MKKSIEKMGQDGANAKVPLKTLTMAMPQNSTGFLPNLKCKYNIVVSAATATYRNTFGKYFNMGK